VKLLYIVNITIAILIHNIGNCKYFFTEWLEGMIREREGWTDLVVKITNRGI
jgi:hypothetical protein